MSAEFQVDDPNPDVMYRGDYTSFAEAKANSSGYEAEVILTRTRDALRKVVRGEAAYERDSVTFDKIDLPFPLLAGLLRAAAEARGKLSVLDFGGALGSTYYQCREFLKGVPLLEWSIVELPAHVDCGQKEFSNEHLQFFKTVEDCLQSRQPNVLLLSGVLQCLPDPWQFFQQALRHSFDWVILDRTPFIPADRDRLTVEIVSPRIYAASYPAWFFSHSQFQRDLPANWEIATEFDALDRQLLDGVEITFKGIILKRKS